MAIPNVVKYEIFDLFTTNAAHRPNIVTDSTAGLRLAPLCFRALEMTEINALSCVAQDDVVSLRIVCTMARDKHDNLEQLDSYGNTALLKACYLGRFECARTILEFGGNIFAINYFGQNALTLATYAGHLPLVQELLRRRSYKDFNLSSLIPAICVATVQKHADLEQFFAQMDPNGVHETQTVHGLGVRELRGMTVQAERLNPVSPPTFIRHRLR